QRSIRRAERKRFPIEADRAGVGTNSSREDIHQRGLAGAILAEQRVNLARARGELDSIERDSSPESSGDGFRFEQARSVSGCRVVLADVFDGGVAVGDFAVELQIFDFLQNV